MGNVRFKGKYVPDKHGKLIPVLWFTDINVNLPEPDCRYHHHPGSSPVKAWHDRVWTWIKKKLFV